MARLKFFLRTKQTKGNASLYVRVNRPTLGISWWLCTGITVDVESWNKAQKSASSLAKYYATGEGQEVQSLTCEVEDVIDDLFKKKAIKGNGDKYVMEAAISDVVNVKGIKSLKESEELAEAEIERNRKAKEEQKRIVLNYYDDMMKRMESGELRQGRHNTRYRASSISVWKTFGKHLRGYLEKSKRERVTFDDLNKQFADGFTNYLEGNGLMLATVNQQINCMRRLCNSAAEEGINSNAVSLKVWRSHEEKDEDKRAEIVLSEEEIDALYNMELKGIKEQVRDVWLLGYFCAQRVSDYSRLSRENFKQTDSGLEVIVLQQQKTGQDMIIPILDERVFALCEKYGFDFPKLSRDTLNRFIKEVGKELSKSVPSLKVWERTLLGLRERRKEESFLEMKKRMERGERLDYEEAKRFRKMAKYAEEHESGDFLYKRDFSGAVIRQRWELIGCHTSRRSQITTMYNSGLYDLKDLMSVSGHQSLKNMEKYLKRDAISQAERIAEKVKKAKGFKLKREA